MGVTPFAIVSSAVRNVALFFAERTRVDPPARKLRPAAIAIISGPSHRRRNTYLPRGRAATRPPRRRRRRRHRLHLPRRQARAAAADPRAARRATATRRRRRG